MASSSSGITFVALKKEIEQAARDAPRAISSKLTGLNERLQMSQLQPRNTDKQRAE